ncbi:MAG: hypothetical protein F4204_13380 [Rhodospirillaceae bacterium]|nr:hypothetical protein [Rhodospirillaceae bacterium]
MSDLRLLACTVLISAGVAAAVAAATVRMTAPEGPRIASVRLAEMTVAWMRRAAVEGRASGNARAWGVALEAALDHVAERHGVVLLPARAVASGTPDLTRLVEAVLKEFLARRKDGETALPPGGRR